MNEFLPLLISSLLEWDRLMHISNYKRRLTLPTHVHTPFFHCHPTFCSTFVRTIPLPLHLWYCRHRASHSSFVLSGIMISLDPSRSYKTESWTTACNSCFDLQKHPRLSSLVQCLRGPDKFNSTLTATITFSNHQLHLVHLQILLVL